MARSPIHALLIYFKYKSVLDNMNSPDVVFFATMPPARFGGVKTPRRDCALLAGLGPRPTTPSTPTKISQQDDRNA
jgi:hypothetical protein